MRPTNSARLNAAAQTARRSVTSVLLIVLLIVTYGEAARWVDGEAVRSVDDPGPRCGLSGVAGADRFPATADLRGAVSGRYLWAVGWANSAVTGSAVSGGGR